MLRCIPAGHASVYSQVVALAPVFQLLPNSFVNPPTPKMLVFREKQRFSEGSKKQCFFGFLRLFAFYAFFRSMQLSNSPLFIGAEKFFSLLNAGEIFL